MQSIGGVVRAVRVLALASVMAVSAGAQSWTFVMTGAAEAPPNSSPATGSARATLAGNILTVTGTFAGLTGNSSAAHFHCCTAAPRTGTSGIATALDGAGQVPMGVTSGTFNFFLDLAQTTSYTSAFLTGSGGTAAGARARLIAGFDAGTAYFNLHSTAFPGGEIRGFSVAVVPEPASVVLMGTGLLALGGIAARRRRN
jgi:hypothetical protein